MEQKNYWKISVEDNGIGFENESRERIFRMFNRLHSDSSYPGTGLGLSMCKKIAELHGGTIVAESEPGRGSKFFITLPIYSNGTNGNNGGHVIQ